MGILLVASCLEVDAVRAVEQRALGVSVSWVRGKREQVEAMLTDVQREHK